MLSSESKKGSVFGTQTTPLVVFGEVLYDCFPGDERVLGGAPFNVAWGLKGFGHEPLLISAVGDDAAGASISQRMKHWGLLTEGLQKHQAYATGEVQVTIEADEPSYEICEGRAWDFIADHGWAATGLIYHGSLALRSETSRRCFENIVARSEAKRFFDINLRPPYDSMDLIQHWVRGVDWLKLNIDELGALVGDRSIEFENSLSAIETLRAEYQVPNVLLTGGRRGARIVGEVGQAVCSPAPEPQPFVDTVGAGDAFSAYTIHGILRGLPVETIIEQASRFAAKVCGLQGATTNEQTFYQ
ncbi:MAG: carbohydrate kinase [Puniceicoccaceae bacterium]|nr:MAG: carbohydrate kinase [Puniceicoccaceae bacterium]